MDYILDLPRLRSIMDNREASALFENIMVRDLRSAARLIGEDKLFQIFYTQGS